MLFYLAPPCVFFKFFLTRLAPVAEEESGVRVSTYLAICAQIDNILTSLLCPEICLVLEQQTKARYFFLGD